MHDIFFFTDIHGMYDLYRAIMKHCEEQDPGAMIIFGGDACDRGRDGYKIMRELLDNPYVVYLKGNHEDIFVQAAKEIKRNFNFDGMDRATVKEAFGHCYNMDKYPDIGCSIYNGGLSTLVDWVMDGMDMEFVERIDDLSLTFSTDTCDFCHAAGVYQTFKRAADAEYAGKKVNQFDRESLIWTRSGFNMGWEPGRTAIFGHTPVQCLNEYMRVNIDIYDDPMPYKWVGQYSPTYVGAKIDMDTGAAFTGITYVLNVLTMKAQGFEDTDILNAEIRKHDVKKIGCVSLMD